MKLMNSIDISMQTLWMAVTIIPGVLTPFVDDIGLIAMFGALILGGWQLLSAIITTVTKGHFLELRKLYLKLCVGYALFIGIGAALANVVTGNVLVIIFVVIALAATTSLAIFYYVITIKTYRASKMSLA